MQRFGIEETFGSGWQLDVRGERFYLKDGARARARKLITEARYNYWKRWIDLLSPVLSLIISFLAFLIAVVALYLQTISTTVILLPSP